MPPAASRAICPTDAHGAPPTRAGRPTPSRPKRRAGKAHPLTAPTPHAAITRRIATYTPRALTPHEWDTAGPAVRDAVHRCEPRNAAEATNLLGAVTAFLGGPTGWDRVSEPDLTVLLTGHAIDQHIVQMTGATGTRLSHRRSLRKVAGAFGRPTPAKQPGATAHTNTAAWAAWATHALISDEPPRLVAAVWAHHHGRPLPEFVLRHAVTAIGTTTPSTVANVTAGTVRTPDTIPVLAAAPDRTARTAQVDTTRAPHPGVAARPGPAPAKRTTSRRQALAFARTNQAIARGPRLAAPVHPEDIDPAILTAVHAYRPTNIRESTWEQMRDLHNRLVLGYQPPTAGNAQAVCSHIARFLVWFTDWPGRATPGQPIAPEELLRDGLAEAYLQACPPSVTSRATIRAAARRALGALHAHGRPQRLPRAPVAAPYTPTECQLLVHLARNQPTRTRRRNLSFIVGLGLGAGLDGRELKDIRPRDLTPLTIPHGQVLTVTTGASRARRVVPVRNQYAPLVLEALALHEQGGGGPDDRTLPGSSTARAAERAVSADVRTRVQIDSRRLRNTWLLALMCTPVPLADLLGVAGLRSARTLTDLLTHCPPPDAADLTAALARIDTRGPR